MKSNSERPKINSIGELEELVKALKGNVAEHSEEAIIAQIKNIPLADTVSF